MRFVCGPLWAPFGTWPQEKPPVVTACFVSCVYACVYIYTYIYIYIQFVRFQFLLPKKIRGAHGGVVVFAPGARARGSGSFRTPRTSRAAAWTWSPCCRRPAGSPWRETHLSMERVLLSSMASPVAGKNIEPCCQGECAGRKKNNNTRAFGVGGLGGWGGCHVALSKPDEWQSEGSPPKHDLRVKHQTPLRSRPWG